MLDIIELSAKNREDLVAIAKELEVHKPESLDKEKLIYAILDQQAIVSKEDPKKRQTRKSPKKKAEKNTSEAAPATETRPSGVRFLSRSSMTSPAAGPPWRKN